MVLSTKVNSHENVTIRPDARPPSDSLGKLRCGAPSPFRRRPTHRRRSISARCALRAFQQIQYLHGDGPRAKRRCDDRSVPVPSTFRMQARLQGFVDLGLAVIRFPVNRTLISLTESMGVSSRVPFNTGSTCPFSWLHNRATCRCPEAARQVCWRSTKMAINQFSLANRWRGLALGSNGAAGRAPQRAFR
jgi:hypothetical protein